MATVAQAGPNPTNKLTAAILVSALVQVAETVVGHFWPWLGANELWVAVTPVLVWAVGYFIKDADNSPAVPNDNSGIMDKAA